MSVTASNSRSERYHATRRVTVIGGVLDLVLGVLKILTGLLSGSQALVADGVHSVSDLVTDVMVIWAAREASRGPDDNHPYGHQRIETVASIVLGAMLVAVALGLGLQAARSIWSGGLPVPGAAALAVAAFSVLGKEAIFRYTMAVARRYDSDLLRSNAWHSRSDALSSIVVLVGVAGTMAGYPALDAAAAMVVAAMIIWVGARMAWRGTSELIDTGLEPRQVARIRDAARQVDGVHDVHDLRTRRMGTEIYLDGHILVDPRISVSEGHRVGEAVRHRLHRDFPGITDITIHIDAEHDENYQKSAHLPLRQDVDSLLAEYWTAVPEAGLVSGKIIHYLDGKLHLEIRLPLACFDDPATAMDAATRLKQALAGEPRIAGVEVLFV